MNLQHERMLSLCETLSLPFVAQGYAVASQEVAEKETAYSDFLEGLLRTEAAGRQVRKQTMLTRLAGFPAIKTLDDFDYQFAAGVKRVRLMNWLDWALLSAMRTWCWLALPVSAKRISPLRWGIEQHRQASRPDSPLPPTCC